MSYLLLGIFIGLLMSAINRVFSFKEIIGFSLLAVGGVLYGHVLGLVLEESMNETLPLLHPILIVFGGLSLTSLKVLLLHRGKTSLHLPHLRLIK